MDIFIIHIYYTTEPRTLNLHKSSHPYSITKNVVLPGSLPVL